MIYQRHLRGQYNQFKSSNNRNNNTTCATYNDQYQNAPCAPLTERERANGEGTRERGGALNKKSTPCSVLRARRERERGEALSKQFWRVCVLSGRSVPDPFTVQFGTSPIPSEQQQRCENTIIVLALSPESRWVSHPPPAARSVLTSELLPQSCRADLTVMLTLSRLLQASNLRSPPAEQRANHGHAPVHKTALINEPNRDMDLPSR